MKGRKSKREGREMTEDQIDFQALLLNILFIGPGL